MAAAVPVVPATISGVVEAGFLVALAAEAYDVADEAVLFGAGTWVC